MADQEQPDAGGICETIDDLWLYLVDEGPAQFACLINQGAAVFCYTAYPRPLPPR